MSTSHWSRDSEATTPSMSASLIPRSALTTTSHDASLTACVLVWYGGSVSEMCNAFTGSVLSSGLMDDSRVLIEASSTPSSTCTNDEVKSSSMLSSSSE
eukprot:CAMPEP_0119373148 /NCGR_PEP_ID=MMETSP1334-20130426/23664_1 /TAXON_ID=127549 /ORGANISM="Calcidiscus leptoporus, Strain RCC1130" /LENGTH=98 /DNA_ID=CAMNT_0007390825 /DNA_START=531 /DNA_END=824 /DNA_ORIENTATION=+